MVSPLSNSLEWSHFASVQTRLPNGKWSKNGPTSADRLQHGPSQRTKEIYIRGHDHTGLFIKFFFFPPSSSLARPSWAVLNTSLLPILNLASTFTVPRSLAMLGISKIFLLALSLSTAQAAPFHAKRIAQVISDSTQKWQAACVRTLETCPSIYTDPDRVWFIARCRRCRSV